MKNSGFVKLKEPLVLVERIRGNVLFNPRAQSTEQRPVLEGYSEHFTIERKRTHKIMFKNSLKQILNNHQNPVRIKKDEKDIMLLNAFNAMSAVGLHKQAT